MKEGINISLLFEQYPGFAFLDKGAELCGFNRDKMEYIVIEDGMCTAVTSTWVVHHYKIVNTDFDPFAEDKYPEDEECKISEKRVRLVY